MLNFVNADLKCLLKFLFGIRLLLCFSFTSPLRWEFTNEHSISRQFSEWCVATFLILSCNARWTLSETLGKVAGYILSMINIWNTVWWQCIVFARKTLLFHCKLIYLCGCQPNSVTLLLIKRKLFSVECAALMYFLCRKTIFACSLLNTILDIQYKIQYKM